MMRVDELPSYVTDKCQQVFEEKVKETTFLQSWGHWSLEDCAKMFEGRNDDQCDRIYKILRDYFKTI